MHIIEPHMLIKHRQLCSENVYSKVSFARAIYHTSKHFCACVGKCTCDPTPLLKGPVTSTMLLFHTLVHVKSILYVHYFISLLFFILSLPVFLPFLNASSAQKWNKTKIYISEQRTGNITHGFAEL